MIKLDGSLFGGQRLCPFLIPNVRNGPHDFENPVGCALKSLDMIIDQGQPLDGPVHPGKGIGHGQKLTQGMVKIDLSDDQNGGHHQKNHRVHQRPQAQVPPVPAHDLFIKDFRQVAEALGFAFSRKKFLHQFDAQKGFMVSGCDARRRVLNMGGILFDFSAEQPDQKRNQGYHEKDQQGHLEVHDEQVHQKDQGCQRVFDQAQKDFRDQPLQNGQIGRGSRHQFTRFGLVIEPLGQGNELLEQIDPYGFDSLVRKGSRRQARQIGGNGFDEDGYKCHQGQQHQQPVG